jgi:prepilin peptidase CpaA
MPHLPWDIAEALAANWPVWLVSSVLIVAAIIDGIQLKVPNWLTYPFVLSGWVYSSLAFGWEGFLWSITGTLLGLALLLPLYSIGGMGAGDVKLLAGVGAWVHAGHTFHAFCVAAITGALLAVMMVVLRGGWRKHLQQFRLILAEIMTIRDPNQLAAIAAARKPSMMLLPYGIPITIGTILYFAWRGLLV